MGPQLQLFHRISDPESARVRRLIVELNLENVQFRNVDVSEQAKTDLQSGTGGLKVPTLLNFEGKWIEGFEAISAELKKDSVA